jgi:8-oxo-dGTP pyrophosphatase MutT (NUDIX family)
MENMTTTQYLQTPSGTKYHPSLHEYAVPVRDWTSQNPNHRAICSALVFSSKNNIKKTLLIQRAPTDAWPLRWEYAGGSCEPSTNETLLDGTTREFFEETGLVASFVKDIIGSREWEEENWRKGTPSMWRKFTFVVELAEGDGAEVTLSPEEHVAYVWASEEEVREERVGDVVLDWINGTERETILKGFEMVRELK